jgi:hypothetical protein
MCKHTTRSSFIHSLLPLLPLLLLLLPLPLLLLLLLLLLCRYTRGNVWPPNSPNITINSGNYRNINPLDFPTADKVWGQYSQRCALPQTTSHKQPLCSS